MSFVLNKLDDKLIKANLLNQKNCIIVQQVNCQGVMGKGLALSIKNKYSKVYTKYKALCSSKSSNELLGGVLYVTDKNVVIANIFGQNGYGYGCKYTDYFALKRGLEHIAVVSKQTNLPVYLPYKIGCGLAGGDWNKVQDIIKSTMTDVDYYVCQL